MSFLVFFATVINTLMEFINNLSGLFDFIDNLRGKDGKEKKKRAKRILFAAFLIGLGYLYWLLRASENSETAGLSFKLNLNLSIPQVLKIIVPWFILVILAASILFKIVNYIYFHTGSDENYNSSPRKPASYKDMKKWDMKRKKR